MEFSMALLLLAVLSTIEGRDDRGTEESGTVWSKRSADPAAAAASGEPKQLDRLTSGTLADFAEYAISGVPVVVPATASGWPLEGLSCEKISNDFASARMRMEYAHKMPEVGAGSEVGNNGEEGGGGEGVANNDGDDGENPQSIGDKSWMSAQIPSGTLVGRVGPKYAPFYWDIKEGDHWVREKIQDFTRIPHVLPANVVNFENIMHTPEIWLSPTTDAGAKAHADEHCESTFSVQLSGVKRWRIGPMPEVTPETFASRHSLGDGVLTMLTPSWVPRYTVDLQPGEAIFMPPGYIHETTNIGEECSASITHQWDSPAAARYIKSSITTIAVHEEMTGCWGKWGVYATLQSRGTFPDDLPEYESFDSVEADAEAKARAVPRELDVDSNDVVTKEELMTWIQSSQLAERDAVFQVFDVNNPSSRMSERYSKAEVLQQLQIELAANIFNYHDVNADAVLTTDEMASNIEEWISLNNRGRGARRVAQKHRAYAEDEGNPCEFVDMVPTWAGRESHRAPHPPPASCLEHVQYYQQLLSQHGYAVNGTPTLPSHDDL